MSSKISIPSRNQVTALVHALMLEDWRVNRFCFDGWPVVRVELDDGGFDVQFCKGVEITSRLRINVRDAIEYCVQNETGKQISRVALRDVQRAMVELEALTSASRNLEAVNCSRAHVARLPAGAARGIYSGGDDVART